MDSGTQVKTATQCKRIYVGESLEGGTDRDQFLAAIVSSAPEPALSEVAHLRFTFYPKKR